ncbi:MAG: DUF1015 domain-containing protein [Gammaproteobacteria bacterium]
MIIKPFRGLRPLPQYVEQVASRPYDVVSIAEARQEVAANPRSFLNVVVPEAGLPADIDPYSDEVYRTSLKNFEQLLSDGVFRQDAQDCLYLYELTMNGRSKDGLVACVAVEDYLQQRIKKHELTRPDKENDRKNHIRVSMLNAEPVMFTYKAVAELDAQINALKTAIKPVYDFTADDGVRHCFRVLDDAATIAAIVQAFAAIPTGYVADGHHRTAAAALVQAELRAANPRHRGDEPYNYFLAAFFPDRQLHIMEYNRLVKDLNGLTADEFLAKLDKVFIVEKISNADKPQNPRELSMYLAGDWYRLTARDDIRDEDDPIEALSVSMLSRYILQPLLDIHDLRRDRRIEFVGGIHGLQQLQNRVDNGEMALAFALYPVSMQQLLAIADKQLILPPKATWFEPKLRSGLIVHSLRQG